MQDDAIDSLFQLLNRTQRLETLPRNGWLVAGVQAPESVAAHSWEAAVVALWLADRVDGDIDRGRLLTIALLHDIGEAMLTDLPKPVKDLLGGEAVEDAERGAAAEVLDGCGDAWQEAVDAYHEQNGPEARLVKAADRIQMLAKALQYDRQKRGDVERFFDRQGPAPDFGFPVVETILEALHDRWERSDWYPADFD